MSDTLSTRLNDIQIGSSPSNHPTHQLPVRFPDNIDTLFEEKSEPTISF